MSARTEGVIDVKSTKRFLNLGIVCFVYIKTTLRSPGNRYVGVYFFGGKKLHGFWC